MICLFSFFTRGYVAADYVKDAKERVKTADWSKMETVKVKFNEYQFILPREGIKNVIMIKLNIFVSGNN
jgi:hypothetical protein